MTLTLRSSLTDVFGVGKRYSEILQRHDFTSVGELLLHFPTDYIDFSKPSSSLCTGEKQLLRITVEGIRFSRFTGRALNRLTVTARCGKSVLSLVFFNQPYLKRRLRDRKTLWVYGRVENQPYGIQMTNPVCFFSPDRHSILPIYRPIGNLKPGRIRRIIGRILEDLEATADPLPEFLRRHYRFATPEEAFRRIHAPGARHVACVNQDISGFIYRECFFFQLELQWIRRHSRRMKRRLRYVVPSVFHRRFEDRLPFSLTPGQASAFQDIRRDLISDFCMQRLLQGDVGSGKTVVMFLAISVALENGYQTAYLAPTELLARQQYETARSFLGDFSCDILTGNTPAARRRRIITSLRKGTLKLLFGTHALLNEDIRFQQLALVAVDEQQRFGVMQRAAMQRKEKDLDLLVATATPIPRTLLLTLFEDIDVTRLEDKPEGRSPVKTRVVPSNRRQPFYFWLKRRMENGKAGLFIVVPLIEPDEQGADIRSLQGERSFYEKLFTKEKTAFLSGQTPPEQRERTLRAFRSGRIRVLVATSVIEVGIDVPGASIMVIENADRFGLSQLHQMRGRVGRGRQPGRCFLLGGDNITVEGQERLRIMASCDDGFQIAERDLEMRGGGVVSGVRQSGNLDFRVVDVRRDAGWMKRARDDVAAVLRDPSLWTDGIRRNIEDFDRKTKMVSFS